MKLLKSTRIVLVVHPQIALSWYWSISRFYPAALYFGRDRKADLPEKQELNTMLLVNFMQSSGRADLVEETFREHRRRGRDGDEKEQVEEPEPKRKAGPSLGERLRAMK